MSDYIEGQVKMVYNYVSKVVKFWSPESKLRLLRALELLLRP